MTYIKVNWLHDFYNEPIMLFSELDNDRFETRKIEFFRGGRIGYASESRKIGDTMLGESPVPNVEEIFSDPQFVVGNLTSEGFELVWRLATE